jgi:formylglycine-generating enzyme required for sulfatase activity
LLYLKELRQEIISNNPSLPNLITQQIKQQKFHDQPLNPPPNWFADKLREQKCLVMLDGLDEVADQTQRQQISRWVGEQMQNYPHTAFILTSRPNGYRTARLQGVEELEVQLFNQKQREDFLHHWYLQKEAHDNRWVIDEGVKQDAETAANDLIQRIENSRPLKAMAVNPLLLTMIATVHRYRGVLPGKRVRLYKEICEILLEKRQTAKKIPDVLTASDKQPVLQVLALQLMQNNTREFILSEATALIPVNMLQTFPPSLANAEDFLKHIRDDCGLLVEKELGIYEFAHLSFQEYLAAVQIKESNQESLLIANINNSWWAETIRLYAAQINNASNLMRAVINMPSPSVNAFVLVSDYEEEGWRIDPQLRQQLIDKLDAGLESNDPEIFKLAAQVKLTRRLNNLQPINENLEIDTSYITCAEYQLFIDVQGSSSMRFSAGNAKNPVIGICWENTLDFCNWLNLYTLSQSRNNYENNAVYYYRLPTLVEAENYLAQARCWTVDGDNTGEKRIRVVKNRVDQDYTQLANYLAAGDWEKAAQETVKVMLKVAHRESEGEFDVASIEKLSSSCLITIDLLWMQYSTRRFGWGVRESVDLSSAKSDLLCGWWLNASGNVKEIFEALVQKHIACGIKRLSPLFAFDVVTINAQGQEIQWERHQAQYFTEYLGNGVTLDMVAIRGGTFTMGSPETEAESRNSERPQHEVTVPPFSMGKYPITQAQWRSVAALTQINRELKPNPSHFKGDDLPVESISWYDAVEFCDRLSQLTGRNYRLPSEAEWEYACRGGTTTPFHFGETITPKLANYNGEYTYSSGSKGEYRKKTTPVGYFKVANAFGLYDLHGNVWEWCADHWHESYKGASVDGSAWIDSTNNNYRMLRGGSWSLSQRNCRSGCRLYLDAPDDGYDSIGFRVAVPAART